MRENTPPRTHDISDEDEDGEFIFFDDEAPEEEFEEIDESDLESILALGGGDDAVLPNLRIPEDDKSEITFTKHTAPVFSCSLHPTRNIAVTGGEDDKAYIWNIYTAQILHEITNHKDTVISTIFSTDGNYLATGDMSGEIQVFKLNDDELIKVWEFSMGDMCWMKWHKNANILLAGSDTGEIYVWRIPNGNCKILPANGEKCETAELTGDGKKLFAGYGNGTVKLWDIKNCTCIVECSPDSPMGHKDGVAGVSCDIDNPLYASGGEDAKILFMSNNGPVGAVEAEGPVELVSFSPYPDLRVIASGSLHGQIAIWDYSKHSLRTVCEHPEPDDGITALQWLPDYTLLVGTIQGNIYGYDVRTGQRKCNLSGHAAEIYDIVYKKDDGIFLTASEDHTAKIFRYP